MVSPYDTLINQNPNSFKRLFGIDINTTKNLWFIVNQNTAITLQVNSENQNAAITLQVNSERIRQTKHMISFAKQTKLYIPNVFIQNLY